MGSLNKATILGHLGSDPDVRTTSTGALVVTLSVATSENWTDKQTGEKRQRTEWHRVVIFNQGLAKIARDYLRKGAQVYLEGQLQTRKWSTDDGQDRYSTEVTLQPYHGVLTLLGGGQGHNNSDQPDEDDSSQTNGISNSFTDGSTGNGTSMAHDDQIPY
jgi:single-strand DNA-binding protein